MRRHDGLLGVISILLVISMLICLGSVLAGAGFSEPENPLGASSAPLIPEVLDGGGSLTGNGEGERGESLPPEDTESPTKPEETEPPKETEPEAESEPTIPADGPTEPEPVPDEDDGSNDSDQEDDGLAGDDGEGPGEGGDTPGAGNDDSVKIRTDLDNLILTEADLPDGILPFFAYPSKEDGTFSVKAVMNNSTTPANGQVLTSADGINYEALLAPNETTIITLYLKENGKTSSYVRYQIRYEAEKADEDNPEVGDHPPFITTNLDGFTGLMETQDYPLWVEARTNPDGDPIYSNQIEVWLNGKLVPKQYGDAKPEYELHFEPPNVGDYAKYTVKVRAWDGKGNSTMKVYTINYHTVSEGDYLGEVTIVLDATTVGLGIIDSETYEIVQGDTAASVVLKFLEEYGYDTIYEGNYLRSISRGGLCDYARMHEKLEEAISRDVSIEFRSHRRDDLGEFDFTSGSGWMYSINGSSPGRSMSDYPLSKDTTIYLRFTLAYGKDIGGDLDSKSYCGIWINGDYTPLEHKFTVAQRVEATETEDGYIEYTCSKCAETKQEIIPKPTEPEATEPPTEPEETVPDETVPEETGPAAKPEDTAPPATEPPETQPPETDPPVTTDPPTPSDDEEE